MNYEGESSRRPGMGGLLQRALPGGKSGYYTTPEDYGSGVSEEIGWANPNPPRQFDPDARALPIHLNQMMMTGNAYGNMDALIEANTRMLEAGRRTREVHERLEKRQGPLNQAIQGGDYNLANRETMGTMDMINNPGRGIY